MNVKRIDSTDENVSKYVFEFEFKHGDGSPTKEQRERITRLQEEGWCVAICWNWYAAARFVQGYAGMIMVSYQ